jgi:hypothetical protein
VGEIHTEVYQCRTFDGQVKYRLKEFNIFDSFTFDNFTTTEFLWWMQVVESAMKGGSDWNYEFEAGGGHSDMPCYLMVHRSKEATEADWEAYMNEYKKKSKDSRRQEYLRLKKEFENEMD